MAEFTGNLAEFTRYVGGFTRNKVQYITSKYRKDKGKCEHCGSKTKKLDAAHVSGNSRPEIIWNILSDHIDNEIITIDLNEFEEKFIKAHEPVNEIIKILCKDCHREYDKKEKIEIIEQEETIEIDEIQEYNTMLSISKSLNNMKKSEALELLNNEELLNDIDSKNIVFSNINNAKDVWWIEPSNSKFKNDMLMLLNNNSKSELRVIKIPKNTIIDVEKLFEQRSDRDSSKIIIAMKDKDLKDNKGFSFKPYLLKTIKY